MGYNTVAVIYNDHTHRLAEDDGRISREIVKAMRGWSIRDRDKLATWFGAGQVISQAHADYTQIVAVGQNTGKPIEDCNDLEYFALQQMAECLIRHGWSAKPPAKIRKPRVAVEAKGG